MKYLIVCIAVTLLTACALPVRPVAKLVPNADGSAHFIPDPDQEPKFAEIVAPGLGIVSTLGLIGGPVGLALAGLATTWARSAATRAVAERKRAEEFKEDANEGWAKAEEHALARTPPKDPKP